MLKIGEFSKLSHLTIKALRFYEKRGLLIPQKVDEQTGYRFYETSQLKEAARIKSYRQLGLSIEEIQAINKGTNLKEVLISKAKVLESQKEEIESRLLMIHHLLDDNEIQYQVIEKMIPKTIVYYSEVKVKSYSDMMKIIPSLKKECKELNPHVKCTKHHMNFVNIWIMNIKKVIFGSDIMKQWNVWAKKVHELCLKRYQKQRY